MIATDVSQEEKIEHNDQQVFDNNADNSLAGEVLQSVMLKKRRKKLQGFVKRYFVLNLKRGSLSYFKVDDNKLRGQMPVKEAIISANPSNRQFIIDSGMEVWHLKAINQADFNAWVNAFNAIKRQDSPNTVVSKPSTPFKSSTELNIILQKLDKLRLENPSPLVGEIHQDILNLINRKSESHQMAKVRTAICNLSTRQNITMQKKNLTMTESTSSTMKVIRNNRKMRIWK